MIKKFIDIQKCKGCELCVVACLKNNIKMSKKYNQQGYAYAKFIDLNRCNDQCKCCFLMCPDVAIRRKI